jgi:hypothetical protein
MRWSEGKAGNARRLVRMYARMGQPSAQIPGFTTRKILLRSDSKVSQSADVTERKVGQCTDTPESKLGQCTDVFLPLEEASEVLPTTTRTPRTPRTARARCRSWPSSSPCGRALGSGPRALTAASHVPHRARLLPTVSLYERQLRLNKPPPVGTPLAARTPPATACSALVARRRQVIALVFRPDDQTRRVPGIDV